MIVAMQRKDEGVGDPLLGPRGQADRGAGDKARLLILSRGLKPHGEIGRQVDGSYAEGRLVVKWQRRGVAGDLPLETIEPVADAHRGWHRGLRTGRARAAGLPAGSSSGARSESPALLWPRGGATPRTVAATPVRARPRRPRGRGGPAGESTPGGEAPRRGLPARRRRERAKSMVLSNDASALSCAPARS